VLVLIAAFFIVQGNSGSDRESNTKTAQPGGDLKIISSEITDTASFIPYNADGTYMELIAVRAPDGTVRTSFNTCQVCYDSGRGYYKQEGDELVCQNCGNRFKISQIEKEKNGCNPIPILEQDKTDDGTTITISESYLLQNKGLFGKWN
jgi:uncharacterized membrane protein